MSGEPGEFQSERYKPKRRPARDAGSHAQGYPPEKGITALKLRGRVFRIDSRAVFRLSSQATLNTSGKGRVVVNSDCVTAQKVLEPFEGLSA